MDRRLKAAEAGEEIVTLELVHRPDDGPVDIGTGFSHIPVRVDDLAATLGQLVEAGHQLDPVAIGVGEP